MDLSEDEKTLIDEVRRHPEVGRTVRAVVGRLFRPKPGSEPVEERECVVVPPELRGQGLAPAERVVGATAAVDELRLRARAVLDGKAKMEEAMSNLLADIEKEISAKAADVELLTGLRTLLTKGQP